MKAYWGVEVWLHSYFDLGTIWRQVVSFTPWTLYPQGKSLWYPLDRMLVLVTENNFLYCRILLLKCSETQKENSIFKYVI